MGPFGLRWSEWLSLGFFAYAAAVGVLLRGRPFVGVRPALVLLLMTGIYTSLVVGERRIAPRAFSITRDWLPIVVTLLAFREMDLFRPAHFDGHLETAWARWDVRFLSEWGVQRALEALGPVIPFLLEASYFLVYGVAAFGVWALYECGARRLVDRFYFIYLAGTLGAYAAFPFLPSEPPRLLYPELATPHVTTWMRTVNLFLLRSATIHMSVFPSAHVSSAFSSAWALLLLLPGRRIIGWAFVGYAIAVAVATVYGRYHYAADAVAGLAVSVAAVSVYRVVSVILKRWN